MVDSADVVVVGAGVIGSAVAYELARQGLRVVVVDKGAGAGQGSTSASSAIMRFHYSTFDGVVAAWESAHCWAEWAGHLGAPAGSPLARLRRTGVVMLDAPNSNRERTVELFGRVGVPFEDWGADDLRRRVPALDPGRFWPPKRLADEAFWTEADGELGALYTADGGFVDDPLLAARNLAAAAARRGARFEFRQAIEEVRRSGDRVAGVTLSGGRQVATPVVVNCAGPWSGAVNALAGVGAEFTITVRPLRQEVHHVTAPPGYHDGDRPGPVIADPDLGIYVRPAAGDAILVGGTEPECDPLDWITDPDDAGPGQTASVFETQVTRAARRFPGLRVPSRPKGIAGVYDVASDWTPIYDRTDLDGYYVAIGTSGNQFKNAPVAGRMMAALVTAVENGHDHDADPVTCTGEHTGHRIDLGTFSRRRPVNPYSTGTVMG